MYVRKYHKVIFSIFILYLNVVNSCKHHKTCRECITDAKNLCVWCASNSDDIEQRCIFEKSYEPEWCKGFVDKPENASIAVQIDKNFSSEVDDVVQIKPQMLNLKLRPGQPLNFTFSFQAAKDYPVDLYILMDASKTMEPLKNGLSSHSHEIYEAIYNMTKNVTMGFGTYIDKNTQPFTNKVLKSSSSEMAYSFKNHQRLTSNYSKLESIIKNIDFGKNSDPQEGGFDALAQVLACDEIIGWRNQSRRMILFITESSHHTAGDGRNAGIFKPYDGHCYTNAEGNYVNELLMDYPSVNTINRLASAKEVIIIFALHQGQSHSNTNNWYQSLRSTIKSSKKVSLSRKNIVVTLTNSYEKISQQIVVNAIAKSGNRNKYTIDFNPDCTANDGENTQCKVEIGARRDFTGTITLNEYYGNGTEQIEISLSEGINEKLTLNIEVIKCACEESEQNVSQHCYGQKFQCGVCVCDASTYGNKCMCSKNKNSNEDADDTQCLSPAGKKCSGNGECNCGHCICREDYFGKFCECDQKLCPGYVKDSNGAQVVCSGQGDCECSSNLAGKNETCSCREGWKHRPGEQVLDCSCQVSTNDMCKVDGQDKLCNGRGECSCNSCKCNDIEAWDKRFKQNHLCVVEPCPECRSMQCSVIQSCVHCLMDSDNCAKDCNGIKLEKKYDVLPEEYLNNTEWIACTRQKVDMGCYTNFVYRYDDKKYRILLRMQEDKNCAESYYMFGGILLFTILAVGILTLLAWKCLIYQKDLREYKKFEAQHGKELGSPCINPLYDEPTTTFRNPAFKRSFSKE